MAYHRSQQQLHSIEDAVKCVGARVNLFAFVSEIGSARKTEGTDYILTLKIADQSYAPPGLAVNFFAETPSLLPNVMANGDIISLHRVVMQVYCGEIYCVFKKNSSSFALFEGQSASSPYQTSIKYLSGDHDVTFLLQLRTWLLAHDSEAGSDDKLVFLRSIIVGETIDVVCKVLYLCKSAEGTLILFGWDGTDAPTMSCHTDLDLERESPCPLSFGAETPPRDVLRAFPRLGTILRIDAFKSFKVIPNLLEGGQWVRLCNMICDQHSGLWKGLLQNDSKIRLLSHKDTTVLRRDRLYNGRISSNVECLPFMRTYLPSHVTETDPDNVVYSSLRNSLAHSEVEHKVMCLVRVIAACPWRGGDFRGVDGQYRVRLTLEDPTARIHAYVVRKCGHDRITFLVKIQHLRN